MDFYTNISNYYDHIFPFDIEQFDFIKSFIIIKKKQNILETGCGTGHLSVKLAEIGLNVHAIDSDQEMINMAEKNKKINFKYPIFKKMDMRSIKYKFSHDFFDLIFCFGNTLPHLTDKEDISAFIKSSHVLLKKKGILLIQVLNYEYILNKNINKLPLIENDEIIFDRTYSNTDSCLIKFNTILTIKKENTEIKNSIKLYPIKKNELDTFLKIAGFKSIQYYSGFDNRKFIEDTLPLIIKAEK